jgi:HK97 gp10 family phage protein
MTRQASVTIEGLDALQRDLAQLGKEVQKGLGKAVSATALDVDRDIKKRIQRGPKTGRTYTRAKGQNLSETHQASAPDEAPATDSGDLVLSIYNTKNSPISSTVGSRLAYAYFLEFGTVRMDARPAWVPAVEKFTPKMFERIDKVLRDATR